MTTDYTHKYLQVEGHKLAYLDEGTGPPVLLVHGIPTSSLLWRKVVPVLSRTHRVAALRNFFLWLAGQPGFRSKLSYSDADYFCLSEKETRVAKAYRETKAPTIEQVHRVLCSMPCSTPIEQRNRAIIALTLLTGARDRAIASLSVFAISLLAAAVQAAILQRMKASD